MKIFLLWFSLILALSFSSSAWAVYKCEVDGATIYRDMPCASGKESQLPQTNSPSAAEQKKAKQDHARAKKQLAKIERNKQQVASREQKESLQREKAAAAKQAKCRNLELKKRWAEEDAAKASDKSSANANTKARRAAEQLSAECEGQGVAGVLK